MHLARSRPALPLVLLAALASGCSLSSPTFTLRSPVAATPPAAPDLGKLLVRAMHTADTGDDTRQQSKVASGIGLAHKRAPYALAFFTGDNLYDCGPDPYVDGAEGCAFQPDNNHVVEGFKSPADSTFAKLHEKAFGGALVEPSPAVYMTLGNHDIGTRAICMPRPGYSSVEIARRKACLSIAHSSRVWNMPARHYTVDQGPVRFIFVDTDVLPEDYGGFTLAEELAFVRSAVEPCGEKTCFLLGHHPSVTLGQHRAATVKYRERSAALLAATGGKVRAFLAGHDHDLQHLRDPTGLDVLVSGNACRGRPLERFNEASVPGTDVLFASVRWGFAELEVFEKGWTYRFLDTDAEPLYCCAAQGTGRCEPVQCPKAQ